MKGFGKSFEIAPAAERPFPESRILWGSLDGGSNRFPTKDDIFSRLNLECPPPLKEFGRAVSEAIERVWVVDEYFLMPDGKVDPEDRIFQILEWLHADIEASDIKILTKPHKEVGKECFDLFQDRATEINNRQARRQKKCSIEVRLHLTSKKFDCVHDRFAIVDDELWHFGATVGGFHAKVSAASRGWRASDHGALDFFRMAWEAGDGL